jgi:RNA polymerase sigma-70 factor, ECF subfamily
MVRESESTSLSRRNTVIDIQTDKPPLNHVTAVFGDGSQSFLLPQGATLGHIADRIDGLGARQEGEAVAVVVKFPVAAPRSPVPFRDGLLAELPRLRAFARSMARNPDRADDLVQETLAKAWAHRSKFKEGTNLGAWLFTILRNTYYGELRSRRREVSDSDGHHAAQLSSPPAQLHYLELQNVDQAFQALPAMQREALFLVGVSGLTYHAAALIGRCAVGTIKSRVFRARKTLLDKLGGPKLPSPAQIGRPQGLAATSSANCR